MLYDQTRSFEFVLTESAIRHRLSSAQVMLVQLDYVASLCKFPNVTIGIVPWTATLPMIPLNPFSVLDSELVVVDTFGQVLLVRSHDGVQEYLDRFESLRASAIYGADFHSVIDSVTADYERLVSIS